MDKIILIMVICFSKTITRGSHPSNGLPISENLFNPPNRSAGTCLYKNIPLWDD